MCSQIISSSQNAEGMSKPTMILYSYDFRVWLSFYCYSDNNHLMSDKRPWSAQEDRLLKYVFETSKLTKWSHIARKLQEQHGVKGRNGKQCKQRYATYIDTSYRREEWSYEEEQRMVDYHNELGNKWAVIGNKLGGKTDNSVKNHFYALLRKALRKINRVIQLHHKREFKQFSPTVLYRIVEVTEERFKLFPNYQTTFCQFSQELKNELIQFSYDDEIEDEEDIDVNMARKFIDKINEFANNYKRKLKKQRKNSAQTQNLLTPTRYQQPQKEESEGSHSLYLSSENSNIEDISDDQLNRSINSANSRRSSIVSAQDTLLPNLNTRSRARSQGNLLHTFNFNQASNFQMEQQRPNQPMSQQIQPQPELKGDISSILGQEGIMAGMEILKEEKELMGLKLITKPSKDYGYYEDSGIQMRIFCEMESESHFNCYQ